MSENTQVDQHEIPGYEKSPINLKLVSLIGVLFVLLLVVISVGTRNFFIKDKDQVIYDQQLQPVSAKLRETRAREEGLINRYKVLDKTAGIYQIPVDRAMAILADRAYKQHEARKTTSGDH